MDQDICNNSDIVDEVELLTLVEEQIPRYKLRYDTITQFSGYENNDFFIKTPLIDIDTPIDLSPDTLKETLNYFVLSSDRLSQMTKTYNDIEAVTKLLEEKERDLELAARIGQSLLDQNRILTTRTEELEAELSASNEAVEKLKFDFINTTERVIQLKHELSMKNGLLQIYSADIEAQEFESETTEQPSDEKISIITNWDELHKKIGNLEEENLRLKCEAMSRANDIEIEEKKELQLIHDCAKQLTEANHQILRFQEEVGHKNEDNIRQQEEMTNMVTQIIDLQRRVRDLTVESESLQNALNVSHDCQNELSLELIEIKEKYGTLLAAFHELQTEFKKRSRINSNHYSFMPFSESLASEIESTLESEGSEGEPSLGFNFPMGRPKKKSSNRDDMRCYSPDSVLSGESFYYRYNNPQPMIGGLHKSYYWPNKLQIVKPIEGSATLRQWQKLATPHLGVILESLPGVPNKAIKDINQELFEFTVNSAKECINSNTNNCGISGQMNFVTTNSIFTYTTTSLSQTTESTSVTPSFSNVQLSTGRDSPITTTCLNLFSQSNERPLTCWTQKDNSLNKMSSLATTSQSIFGLESNIEVDFNVKNALNNEISTDMMSPEINSPESGLHLICNHNNNNESNTYSDKRSEHSPLKHSINSTNWSNKGLGGMSSLFDSCSSDGVIMKCNSLSLKSKANKPNSLSFRCEDITIDSNDMTNVSDFSLFKTLRKGGFV